MSSAKSVSGCLYNHSSDCVAQMGASNMGGPLSDGYTVQVAPLVLKRPKSILFLFSLILNMSYYYEYLTLLKKIVVVTGNRKT